MYIVLNIDSQQWLHRTNLKLISKLKIIGLIIQNVFIY